jgi:hypothetical protein
MSWCMRSFLARLYAPYQPWSSDQWLSSRPQTARRAHRGLKQGAFDEQDTRGSLLLGVLTSFESHHASDLCFTWCECSPSVASCPLERELGRSGDLLLQHAAYSNTPDTAMTPPSQHHSMSSMCALPPLTLPEFRRVDQGSQSSLGPFLCGS